MVGRGALEGMMRAEAARLAGMERQALRNAVVRYSAEGLAGLRNRPHLARCHGWTQRGACCCGNWCWTDRTWRRMARTAPRAIPVRFGPPLAPGPQAGEHTRDHDKTVLTQAPQPSTKAGQLQCACRACGKATTSRLQPTNPIIQSNMGVHSPDLDAQCTRYVVAGDLLFKPPRCLTCSSLSA